MQINWFEIIAQIINFFIILFLLHKLFYKPVINAMEARQERITSRQKEADSKMENANELIEAYEDKMEEIEKKKKDILTEAKQDALEEKEKLMEQYKEEAQKKGEEYLNELEEDKESYLNELRRSLGKNAVKIAAQILSTLSSTELEEEVFHTFIDKIKTLDQESLDKESSSDHEELIVTSSTEVSKEQKEQLEKTLEDKIGRFKRVSYHVEEDLILGYELRLETITVHTTIKKYLDEAESHIIETLDKKSF